MISRDEKVFFNSVGVDHTAMPRGRYIKQIKVRSAELQYGDNNVITASLE